LRGSRCSSCQTYGNDDCTGRTGSFENGHRIHTEHSWDLQVLLLRLGHYMELGIDWACSCAPLLGRLKDLKLRSGQGTNQDARRYPVSWPSELHSSTHFPVVHLGSLQCWSAQWQVQQLELAQQLELGQVGLKRRKFRLLER